jgi:hypothetical protein
MEDENEIYLGTLFDTINYKTEDDLESFIDGMDKNQANYVLQLAIQKSISYGLFTLEENEVLSKSLRVIRK